MHDMAALPLSVTVSRCLLPNVAVQIVCGFWKKTLLAHEDEVHGWTLAGKEIDYGFQKKGKNFLGI